MLSQIQMKILFWGEDAFHAKYDIFCHGYYVVCTHYSFFSFIYTYKCYFRYWELHDICSRTSNACSSKQGIRPYDSFFGITVIFQLTLSQIQIKILFLGEATFLAKDNIYCLMDNDLYIQIWAFPTRLHMRTVKTLIRTFFVSHMLLDISVENISNWPMLHKCKEGIFNFLYIVWCLSSIP